MQRRSQSKGRVAIPEGAEAFPCRGNVRPGIVEIFEGQRLSVFARSSLLRGRLQCSGQAFEAEASTQQCARQRPRIDKDTALGWDYVAPAFGGSAKAPGTPPD